MTEALVTGTSKILECYQLPYVPMVHCFLVFENHRVDLSEGNRNGKNGPIDDLLYTVTVEPCISANQSICFIARHLPITSLNDPILKTRK